MRFASPGNFASLRPHGRSRRESNGQEKRRRQHQARQPAPGLGLRRSGARAVRYNERKALLPEEEPRTPPVVAIKAVAHKLARASYHASEER